MSKELIYYINHNYISNTEKTHFYLTLIKPYKYGACINIKDIEHTDEIIQTMLKDRRQNIQNHFKDRLKDKFIKELTENNKENEKEYFLLLKYNGNITKWIKDKKRGNTKAISKTPSNE